MKLFEEKKLKTIIFNKRVAICILPCLLGSLIKKLLFYYSWLSHKATLQVIIRGTRGVGIIF